MGRGVWVTLSTCSKHYISNSRRSTPTTTSWHGSEVRRPTVSVNVVSEDPCRRHSSTVQPSTKNIQHVAELTLASMITRAGRSGRTAQFLESANVIRCKHGRGAFHRCAVWTTIPPVSKVRAFNIVCNGSRLKEVGQKVLPDLPASGDHTGQGSIRQHAVYSWWTVARVLECVDGLRIQHWQTVGLRTSLPCNCRGGCASATIGYIQCLLQVDEGDPKHLTMSGPRCRLMTAVRNTWTTTRTWLHGPWNCCCGVQWQGHHSWWGLEWRWPNTTRSKLHA